MKKWFPLIALVLFFASCDDGDVIVTDFNFDSDSNLSRCQNGSLKVFYIVNTDPDESISFSFSDDDYDGTYENLEGSETETVNLNSSNKLVYRTYKGIVDGNAYFCSGIPPSSPKVDKEYTSKNGGTITLTTTITEQDEESTTFRTHATAHDVTLKNTNGNEEIVEETLRLGFFTVTETQ